ncbi:LOW QUALITY PROTEIN: reverse transcriptase [Phytophthora megakarya]|uniref:Reverse transcriptase n=1 Tax=Phytophthora megakarya TaxID=4795 RepID=A0A225VIK2_9STRA|nr:LOW QUALITY PROTEIN: reverse transcriptase [Phytophthora megakarya]
MVQAGIIRPSTSAYCAPTFCVKKPVGWRIVHDYHLLNSATILPAIPMPRKDDTFDAMGVIDYPAWIYCGDTIKSNYMNQIFHLRRFRRPTVFLSSPDGLFEYLVTPMGLNGSTGTFNRLLQRVFSALCDGMRIYFDDIYVYTQDQDVQKHVDTLYQVLMRCQEQLLYVKLSMCQLCVEEILCLGDFVGHNGVSMDPDKVRVIKEWPAPRTKKQMERFWLQIHCMKVLRVYARKKPYILPIINLSVSTNLNVDFQHLQSYNFLISTNHLVSAWMSQNLP